MIEHWDGRRWTAVASPNVGPSDNVLTGVVALPSTDVWAVGRRIAATEHGRTLIELWNGLTWSVVASPNVGALDNGLSAVAATGRGSLWAAGSVVDPAGLQRPLLLHWAGHRWRVVRTPTVAGSSAELAGVAAAGTAVTAVGRQQSPTAPAGTLVLAGRPTVHLLAGANPGTDGNELAAVTTRPAGELLGCRGPPRRRASPP